MRRFVGILAVFAILATATVAWRAIPNQASTLSGAWLLASVTDTAGNVNEAPQPGLAVITGTHYSMMYVNGNERRERYPGDSPTNTERLAAYNTFIANSGRYEVDGDQLTFQAYVAKDPNYMGDWPDNGVTVTFQVDGDTLHWTWSNASVLTLTFTRIEGQPAP
jgi:hypothetical protein